MFATKQKISYNKDFQIRSNQQFTKYITYNISKN